MKKYHMRRQERRITDTEEINEILKSGKYATIALSYENQPYIVTLSYGYDDPNGYIYFHAALQGRKIDYIKANPKVCVTIIEDGGYVMGECGHRFRSIIIEGEMEFVESMVDKKHGMNIILEHLEENPSSIRKKAISSDAMYERLAVLRLTTDGAVGKKGQ